MDLLLREALSRAEGEEVFRAVMLLASPEAEGGTPPTGQGQEPTQFGSRKAYREALIARQRANLSKTIGETLQALEGLSLRPRGGTLGRTVVIEGSARNILSALELPGVLHASLDREIILVEPRRAGRRKRNKP
jgi:hypothetical protein